MDAGADEPVAQHPHGNTRDTRKRVRPDNVELVTLTAGTRFGAYEVAAPIGAGGMGEVYRARDTRLDREESCRDTVVTDMLGGTPAASPDRYLQVSAPALLPLDVPQRLIWGEHESFVPRSLVDKYVAAAARAGDDARLIIVPCRGYFEIAMPTTAAWPIVHEGVLSLLR